MFEGLPVGQTRQSGIHCHVVKTGSSVSWGVGWGWSKSKEDWPLRVKVKKAGLSG